jgi:glycosyltransferase involved in cell wall biosynthesis
VVIAGKGADWERCKEHIKYPDIIETDIRRVENEEIPNLFNGCHFLVQPYRVVSQSGPMKIAFRYNLPDIVSNLPGLMCELIEGVNGYSFQSEDVSSLTDVMEKCIKMSDEDYSTLLDKMKDYTKQNYSFEVIINKYCDMFEKVINLEN